MEPPRVLYPFLTIPGREVSLSPIEQLVFTVSLLCSRRHFFNAELVADEKWTAYLRSLPLFKLFTHCELIRSDRQNLEAFWATEAKYLGLNYSRLRNSAEKSSRSVLLLDADCIVFDPIDVIRWDDPHLAFGGGYREPLNWEAYREQPLRLKNVTEHVWFDQGYTETFPWLSPPINGACLFFNEGILLSAYLALLNRFMEYFAKAKLQPRAYLKNPADPSAGTVFFSEGMMADQRQLGALVDYHLQHRLIGDVRFFTPWELGSEYPPATRNFFHLWKLKVELRNATMAALLEQSLLYRLNELMGGTQFLSNCGYTLVEGSVPMSPDTVRCYRYFKLLPVS